MAYENSTLQQAKKAFLCSKGDGFEYDNWANEPKYSFRARTLGAINTLPSTWLDQDDTSDYDPKEHKTSSKRKRPVRTDYFEPGASPSTKKVSKAPKGLVNVSLKPEEGKAVLSTFPAGEDGASAYFDYYEEPIPWMKEWETPETLDGELGTKYAFRKRDRHVPDSLLGGYPGTQSLLSLDLGHPAARGCRSCWEFSRECSLLGKPYVYPCQVCKVKRVDCELVIAPKWKRPCENCKSAKKSCSYNHGDTDHSGPCKQCHTNGIDCVAGPTRSIPESRGGGGESHADAQVEDGEGGIAPGGLPLPKLAKLNEDIQPLRLPGDDAIVSGGIVAAEAESAPGSEKDNEESDSQAIAIGVTRTIQTCFAHPVKIAYDPPSDGSAPCHWCRNIGYGLTGLGHRTVEVIDYGDGKYIEIGGGHVGEGQPSSRMCRACTQERVEIRECIAHQVVPLEGYDINTFDFDAAYKTLAPAVSDEGLPRNTNLWCSLCPNPAFFECGTIPARRKIYPQLVDGRQARKGCGLLLCESCARRMKRYNGDLERVVEKNQRGDAEFGSRADVVFLLRGDELFGIHCGLGS